VNFRHLYPFMEMFWNATVNEEMSKSYIHDVKPARVYGFSLFKELVID
jgi:hypothetical protein